MKGKIISGEFGKILIREKAGTSLELGELLIADEYPKILLQVYDLVYGSQLSQANLELISGMTLEENHDLGFMDPQLRNYRLALLKTLVTITSHDAQLCKTLPSFFSSVREIVKEDFTFLNHPEKSLYLGNIRSGSRNLEIPLLLDGEKVFTEHLLIAASTGKGKSNLMSCMLWHCLDKDYCGILVLDPHDEYYGRTKKGLKDHQQRERVIYYTPTTPPPGARSLKINIKDIQPHHFNGVVEFTDAQKDAIHAYYKQFGDGWIQAIISDQQLLNVNFFEGTLAVIKRKLIHLLDVDVHETNLRFMGIFDTNAGATTIHDIAQALENQATVIVDTSHLRNDVEILVGSLLASEIFSRYKKYKLKGITNKPVISIVIEEAPRVIGKDILQKGNNIFATIAREGRKFKVGLTAITQLPSLIPRDILANMNTKIILGLEMAPERKAIIESASQDLSTDDRSIASLDKGEAIVTSTFSKFAMPIKIPEFKTLLPEKVHETSTYSFNGVETL
ncbi:ATP-binding protein [Candidatus Woesearchaeota archaeon]|nr:ATP-binding protein [Candidatus Woesearchaeota archaeon]